MFFDISAGRNRSHAHEHNGKRRQFVLQRFPVVVQSPLRQFPVLIYTIIAESQREKLRFVEKQLFDGNIRIEESEMREKIFKIPHGILEPSRVVNMDIKDIESIAGINLRACRLRKRYAHRAAGCQDGDTFRIGSVQVQKERRQEAGTSTGSARRCARSATVSVPARTGKRQRAIRRPRIVDSSLFVVLGS